MYFDIAERIGRVLVEALNAIRFQTGIIPRMSQSDVPCEEIAVAAILISYHHARLLIMRA